MPETLFITIRAGDHSLIFAPSAAYPTNSGISLRCRIF